MELVHFPKGEVTFPGVLEAQGAEWNLWPRLLGGSVSSDVQISATCWQSVEEAAGRVWSS